MELLDDIGSMTDHILLGIVGAVVLALTGILSGQSLYRILFWNCATGRVIGFKREHGCYFPRITFIDVMGVPIEFLSDSGRGVRGYKKGDEIRLLYNPRNPHKAAIRDFWHMWAPPILVGAIATVFVLIAIKQWGG